MQVNSRAPEYGKPGGRGENIREVLAIAGGRAKLIRAVKERGRPDHAEPLRKCGGSAGEATVPDKGGAGKEQFPGVLSRARRSSRAINRERLPASAGVPYRLVGRAKSANGDHRGKIMKRRLKRHVLPIAGTAVLGLAATAAAVSAAPAHRANAATGPVRQALSPVTGKLVNVAKPLGSTPVSPEKLTHPQNDDMGTVSAAGLVQQVTSGIQNATSTRRAGIDISSHQGNVNWAAVAPHIDFSIAKATEGTSYTNPYYGGQNAGAASHGLIHGAYHFAIPDDSGGAAQADFFVAHGGGHPVASKTLPGTLDIEYNPYGPECYGLSQSQMRTWIRDFADEYAFDTGVFPIIYTTAGWWNTCTGNLLGAGSGDVTFGLTDPLWVASYSPSAGPMPAGYLSYAIWQYAAAGRQPGDQDYFNGPYAALLALADG